MSHLQLYFVEVFVGAAADPSQSLGGATPAPASTSSATLSSAPGGLSGWVIGGIWLPILIELRRLDKLSLGSCWGPLLHLRLRLTLVVKLALVLASTLSLTISRAFEALAAAPLALGALPLLGSLS